MGSSDLHRFDLYKHIRVLSRQYVDPAFRPYNLLRYDLLPGPHPCLLRTIHHLSSISGSAPAYVAIENRDPLLVSKTLQDARDVWKFDVTRVPNAKLTAALKKGGVNWADDEWEGVEIWKLQLKEAVLD